MALIYCTKCGHRVSTTAPRCPGCGAARYQTPLATRTAPAVSSTPGSTSPTAALTPASRQQPGPQPSSTAGGLSESRHPAVWLVRLALLVTALLVSVVYKINIAWALLGVLIAWAIRKLIVGFILYVAFVGLLLAGGFSVVQLGTTHPQLGWPLVIAMLLIGWISTMGCFSSYLRTEPGNDRVFECAFCHGYAPIRSACIRCRAVCRWGPPWPFAALFFLFGIAGPFEIARSDVPLNSALVESYLVLYGGLMMYWNRGRPSWEKHDRERGIAGILPTVRYGRRV